MSTIAPQDLANAIKQIFLNQDKFIFDKYVPEFMWEGKFFGDYYNSIMVESLADKPPIFYHSLSPFDVMSHKAPCQAVVFQDGKVLLNIDFADYVNQRTGVMDALLLQALGVKTLAGKNILFVGTGRVAKCSLTALKALYPDVQSLDYLNSSGHAEEFIGIAKELNVEGKQGKLSEIGKYDYIFCHADPKEVILTVGMKKDIKNGAVITSFITTAGAAEVADDYFDTDNANVIIDWDKTLTTGADIKRLVTDGIADPDKMICLKDLFAVKAKLNPDAHYTLYRSHGTPMQNLAILKLLLKK